MLQEEKERKKEVMLRDKSFTREEKQIAS